MEQEDSESQETNQEVIEAGDRRRRMLELDQEMKTKLQELKDLMHQEGLEESSQEADNVLKLMERGQNKNSPVKG